MDLAALDPVHQGPTKRGPFLPQCRDRLCDLDRGVQVVLDHCGEPGGVLFGDLDAPRHTVPSRLNSRDALILRTQRGSRQRKLSGSRRTWGPLRAAAEREELAEA